MIGRAGLRWRGALTLIAGGAAATVVCAWVAACVCVPTTGELHTGGYAYPFAGRDLGYRRRVEIPGDWFVRTWQESRGPGLRWDLVSECQWMGSTLGMSESTNPNRTKAVETCGWPLACLQRTVWESGVSPAPPGTIATMWREGVPAPLARGPYRGSTSRALPVRPLAWPTAANVALWAGVLALIGWAWRWARSRRRRRRRQCVTCGYDRSAGPTVPCPECGREPDTISPARV